MMAAGPRSRGCRVLAARWSNPGCLAFYDERDKQERSLDPLSNNLEPPHREENDNVSEDDQHNSHG